MFTPKASGGLYAGRRGSRPGTPGSGPAARRTPLLTTNRLRTGGVGGSTPISRASIIEDTGSCILATWSSSLPVLVTEVLTLSPSGEVSVCLAENGWAWLVSGRRLIVWRFTGGGGGGTSGRSVAAAQQCRELALPPSDLAHRAELCCVYSRTAGQTPCALAASPEGVVRYWPSIAHEGSSTELSTELGGQECFSLTDLNPVGCVLATTSATLVLIHHNGQGVEARRLQAPAGLLGGIGRRVSSLLWGTSAAAGAESKLIRVGGIEARDQDARVALVLTSSGLQKWQLEDGEQDRLYYECDVAGIARESMWAAWSRDGEGSPSWLRLWMLDLAVLSGGRVAVLLAATNQNDQVSQGSSLRVRYGVAVFRVQSDAPPLFPISCPILNYTTLISEGEEPRPLHLLVVEETGYIFSRESVMVVGLNSGAQEEKLSLGSGDALLGSGSVDTAPLFFTSQYGIVTLTQSQKCSGNLQDSFSLNTSLAQTDRSSNNQLSDSLNITVSNQGLENLTMSESKTDQLKAAFLLHCQRDTAQAQSIIEDIFPVDEANSAGGGGDQVDASLDRHVVSLSKELIDDFPASDPRWVESLPQSQSQGVGSSMSLLVLHQLEDKLTCHEFYLGFLRSTGLWSRLSAVTVRGRPMPTLLCLAENAEKNVAAVTLRTVHNDHQATVDAAMKIGLAERELTTTGSLTVQDYFYREISRVDDILESFVTFLHQCVRGDSPRELYSNIADVNSVVVTVLREVVAARNRKLTDFQVTGSAAHLEYLPWTASRRGQLVELVKLTLQNGLTAAEDSHQKARLQNQVVELSDIILDGYRGQLTSLEGVQTAGGEERRAAVNKQMVRDREALIGPLVDRGLYDEAGRLAERYQDFDALVRICEETGDRQQLETYMETFSSQNFSQHVFSWYVKAGRQGRLLSATEGTAGGRSKELGRFLSGGGHSGIAWLHDIHTQTYRKASATLKEIGQAEVDILSRKKTQISLAKLAALAADEEGEGEEELHSLDQELLLVNTQEQISSSVLDQFGMEKTNMRVLSPREMIEMFVSEENVDADHVDFKKALDLLDFVRMDSEDLEKVKLHIWCQSILRNAWRDIDTDNPIESVKDTVFFRLVEFAFMQGVDLRTYLPSPESLLAQEELGSLREDNNFQFLLQSGYEHIQRVCAF